MTISVEATAGGGAVLSDELKFQHAMLIERLYAAVAHNRGLEVFGELSETSKNLIRNDARRMCAAWAADPVIRESHVAGNSEIVDLVALQHQLLEQIGAAETGAVAKQGPLQQTPL